MKKTLFSLIVFSFLIGGWSALAQDDNLLDPGLTPDSHFYFLKSWKEKIQTFFTFGEENKAKQFLHLADVRLVEYEKMIEKGKTEIAQKTLEKYEKQLNSALEKADQAKEKGKDVEKLKEAISEKILKHQEVLKGVLEKIPEEAKEGIKRAIESSQKGFEKAIEAVTGEKKEELERKAEEIKSRIEEKIEEKIKIVPVVPEDKLPQEAEEIRYYTCPDGTKVVSGECYGEGETLRCALKVSPELQCPAPTPPVTAGAECQTLQETKYYQCSNGQQVPWCVCGPLQRWKCVHLPELSCSQATATPTPAPTPYVDPYYTSCNKGEMKDHKCTNGTMISWKCSCFNYTTSPAADYHYNCFLEPVKFCPASAGSSLLTINNIEIRYVIGAKGGGGFQIFWDTNEPARSYIEYGPTISYGFTISSTYGPTGSSDLPDTKHVVQNLSVGLLDYDKLRPDTLYHFRIIAEDSKGNRVVSQDYTFTTVLQK